MARERSSLAEWRCGAGEIECAVARSGCRSAARPDRAGPIWCGVKELWSGVAPKGCALEEKPDGVGEESVRNLGQCDTPFWTSGWVGWEARREPPKAAGATAGATLESPAPTPWPCGTGTSRRRPRGRAAEGCRGDS